MKINARQAVTLITGHLWISVSEGYLVLNSLTRDSLYTHQLGRAIDAAQEYVAKELPQLKEFIDQSGMDFNKDGIKLANEIISRFGDSFEVSPIPNWKSMNPIAEAILMRYGNS